MINLQKLKQEINSTHSSLKTEDFIRIHKGVEGYFRRLLFIGLRINGVKYDISMDVIRLSYLDNRVLLSRTIELISHNSKSLIDFENANHNLKVLLKLFFEFTSIYRNRILHGVDEEIYDPKALRYCYFIDKHLVIEFEQTLQTLQFKSAFSKPKEWGAGKVYTNESINRIIIRLRLGIITQPPKGLTSVENALNSTKYKGRF